MPVPLSLYETKEDYIYGTTHVPSHKWHRCLYGMHFEVFHKFFLSFQIELFFCVFSNLPAQKYLYLNYEQNKITGSSLKRGDQDTWNPFALPYDGKGTLTPFKYKENSKISPTVLERNI